MTRTNLTDAPARREASQPCDEATNGDEPGHDIVNLAIDDGWLSQRRETALEPELEIVDPHHHLWDRPGARYMPPDLLADIAEGHRVTATVYVENAAMWRSGGPATLRPVGETEMMAAMAEPWSRAGGTRLCAGIVGYADLRLGDAVAPVLEAHVEAGRGRFRGVRQVAIWRPESSLRLPQDAAGRAPVEGLMRDPRFREGFARLAPLDLGFDVFAYHTQLGEVIDLADAFPDTTIILDHIGGPIGAGRFRGRRGEVFGDWAAAMTELARRPNVSVKLGGLGMRVFGFDYRLRPAPPSSAELARDWRSFIELCIERFGARRCMFESNFPVDKAYFGCGLVWNAFKRLAAGASDDDKRELFCATAARVYRLPI